MTDRTTQVDFNFGTKKVFEDYKKHGDSHRIDTQLNVSEIIQTNHKDFHVTCVSPGKCDILGYAAAGNAIATLESGNCIDWMRYYIEPGARLENKPGVLKDHVRFGRWRYLWKGYEFLVYDVLINERSKVFYVLSPLDMGVVEDGHISTTDELLLAVGAWSTELHEEIYVMDAGSWTKSKDLWKSVQGCLWDEVILDSSMKASLIEDVNGFFESQQLYKRLQVPWKRGLILHGVPGNGKTISIKAFINTLTNRANPIPSLYVKSFEAAQGSKYAIRTIFSHARIMAPCLLIFEDLDSLVTDQTRSYFLNEVDGLESNDGILMIGSTNNLSVLDPAISKRPSRFDRKYHFHLPGEKERMAYCQFWRRKLIDNDMVDFQDDMCSIIAKMTEGFSFAYLKELFVWALLTIARGGLGDEGEVAVDKDASQEGSSAGDSTISPGLVIVESAEVIKQASENSSNPESTDNSTTVTGNPLPKKKPVEVPEVEVPSHLQDNVFLKVIRGQIKMLIEEMDNSKENPDLVKREKVPGRDMVAQGTMSFPSFVGGRPRASRPMMLA